jgi:hypothetical protein
LAEIGRFAHGLLQVGSVAAGESLPRMAGA